MGHFKLLLPLGDRPVITHCIEAFLQSGIRDIIIVTGRDGHAIQQALQDLPVTIIQNPVPDSDMAGSVRAGFMEAIGEGIFILPADFPLVSPETIAGMICMFGEGQRIIIPRWRGKNGHPVLFPRSRLFSIFGVPTLRDVIALHKDDVQYIDVADEGVVLDMDTPEDYREVLLRYAEGVSL